MIKRIIVCPTDCDDGTRGRQHELNDTLRFNDLPNAVKEIGKIHTIYRCTYCGCVWYENKYGISEKLGALDTFYKPGWQSSRYPSDGYQ